jgi:hypothetical protein
MAEDFARRAAEAAPRPGASKAQLPQEVRRLTGAVAQPGAVVAAILGGAQPGDGFALQPVAIASEPGIVLNAVLASPQAAGRHPL